MIVIIINCQNGSGKPRKFSRSWMIKQTVSLDSSRDIQRPRKVSSNFETVRIFLRFSG